MIEMDSLGTGARRAKPISLTALIDVVFILLMFFMLTSSFSQWQMLALVKPSSHEQAKQDSPPVLLVYEKDFALLTDTLKRPIALNKIMGELSEAQLSQALVISAEASVTISRLLETYESLKVLGFKNLQIGQSVTQKK